MKQIISDQTALNAMGPSSTCSLTQPNSLVQGCLDGVAGAATNPGSAGLAAASAGGAAYLANNSGTNPLTAVGSVLGTETLGACAAGAINTAVNNCNQTSTVNNSTPPEPTAILGVDSITTPTD